MRKQMTAAGLAWGLALAVPAAALSATSALAVPLTATLVGNNVTVSPGGVVKPITFRVDFSPNRQPYTVVLDLTAVSRLADLTPDLSSDVYQYHCDQTTTTLTCSTGDGSGTNPTGGPTNASNFLVRVTPHAAVTPGDVADVPVRLIVDGATVARDTVRVTVGEGVDLAFDGPWMSFDAKVGQSFDLRLPVRNVGTTAVAGAVVFISKNDLLRTPEPGYRNCLYDVHDFWDANSYYDGGAGSMACTFDADLAPGRSYHLSAPLRIHLGQDVWAPSTTNGTVVWYTPQDWADQTSTWAKMGLPRGHRGTGATLRLVQTVTARQAAPPQTQADGQASYQGFRVFIGGDHRSNLTAQGATVTARVGQSVKVRVSVRNNGPARLDGNFGSSPQPETGVAMPPGATVVNVATGCFRFDPNGPIATPPDSKLKPGDHQCGKADPLFLPGTTRTWEFTVRLDQVMNRSRGEISTWLNQNGIGLAPPDPKPSDDKAPIYLTALAPSTGGGGGGAGGGGLPITGTDSALLAMAGVLLLLTGAGIRLLARRR